MNLEELTNKLEQADDLRKLSNVFLQISNALNSSCNNLFQCLFDYKFSKYLYLHYILLNETKEEISKSLNIPSSTVYYYIRKYKLKKDNLSRQKRMLSSMQKTCQEKYGINHPGQLLKAHEKRIENIVIKSNGNYNKSFYPNLNKTPETIEKMKISQQYRRKCEKESEVLYE